MLGSLFLFFLSAFVFSFAINKILEGILVEVWPCLVPVQATKNTKIYEKEIKKYCSRPTYNNL